MKRTLEAPFFLALLLVAWAAVCRAGSGRLCCSLLPYPWSCALLRVWRRGMAPRVGDSRHAAPSGLCANLFGVVWTAPLAPHRPLNVLNEHGLGWFALGFQTLPSVCWVPPRLAVVFGRPSALCFFCRG